MTDDVVDRIKKIIMLGCDDENVAAEVTNVILAVLRPGDELPGGLVVVLKNLLRVALGLDRKKPLDITTSALVEAGARHDLIAILAAAKEGTK